MKNIINNTYLLLTALWLTNMPYAVAASQLVGEHPKENEAALIWQQGTIQHFTFEAGFYGIVTDEGKKLLPMNLPENYQKPGMMIKVKGKLITDMMTINQWGTPFQIIEIVPVDK
jgi:hypothetical protein